jgi:hypothetical protein
VVGYDGSVEEFAPSDKDGLTELTLIGSVFNGAFLHAIARGKDAFAAARLANQVASYKGRNGGGASSLPSEEDLAAA